uniref:Uncharacterized protein n=1 Tax=Chrysotila carterae TaxID=13221 RepID=A0A6S9RSR8_CHRCT
MPQAVAQFSLDDIADRVSLFQTHQFGQIVAGNVIPNTPSNELYDLYRKLLRWGVAGYSRYDGSLFAYGFYHGTIWYLLGMSNEVVDWKKIQYEQCTYATYEFVATCAHGMGHAGFIRAQRQRQPFDVCGHVRGIHSDDLEAAWGICASAPSPWLQRMCSNGYYHAVFEQMDHVENKIHWMYPCNTMLLPFQEMCFGWLFIHMPLSMLPGLPFQGVVSRRKAFEQAGNVSKGDIQSVCFSEPMETEWNQRACIWGLSAVAFGGYWKGQSSLGAYFNMFRPDLVKSETPLIGWCSTFLDHVPSKPSEPMSQSDERRWLACISGSTNLAMSHAWRTHRIPLAERSLLCEQLLAVPWMSEQLQLKSFHLCGEVTRYSTETYVRSGPHDSQVVNEYGVWPTSHPATWDDWLESLPSDEQYGLWPLHNYKLATENETTINTLNDILTGASRDRFIRLSTFKPANSQAEA